MTIGMIVGSLLLLWLVFDLFSGKVYLWRSYERSQEPGAYWGTILLWLVIALSCFFFWY